MTDFAVTPSPNSGLGVKQKCSYWVRLHSNFNVNVTISSSFARWLLLPALFQHFNLSLLGFGVFLCFLLLKLFHSSRCWLLPMLLHRNLHAHASNAGHQTNKYDDEVTFTTTQVHRLLPSNAWQLDLQVAQMSHPVLVYKISLASEVLHTCIMPRFCRLLKRSLVT